MAGSKRQLANGTWELAVSVGSTLKGTRDRRYRYVEASGPREADGLLADFVSECRREDYSEGGKMLLKDYIPKWMEDYAEDNCKRKTVSGYDYSSERVIEYLGHYSLQQVANDPTLLTRFYKALKKPGVRKDTNRKNSPKNQGLSIKTIRNYHAFLSSAFQSAVGWNLIKENPCARVKPPKERRNDPKKKRRNYLTIEQAKVFLDALDKLPPEQLKYKVMVFLAICTGYRRGEVMGLEWPDFDWGRNSVTIERTSLYTTEDGIYEDSTKTDDSERETVFPPAIVQVIREYRKQWEDNKKKAGDRWNDTQRLFVQWNGLPMHPDTISQWFPEFIQKNNLPHVTYHGLRHTYGSILFAMGMDLESIAALLGHRNIQMFVQTYGHAVKEKANKEAAVLIDKALLQEKTPPVPEKPDIDTALQTLPEDLQLLIKRVISTYAPTV